MASAPPSAAKPALLGLPDDIDEYTGDFSTPRVPIANDLQVKQEGYGSVPKMQPSLKGDWEAFGLLLGLYFLQGVPMGLSSSIPLFLASKGVDFAGQAIFSLAPWPYSLKLLWAPLVDAVYTTRYGLGQRKSWIVPTQFVMGVVLMLLASQMDSMFGDHGAPDVMGLATASFVLYFLAATQDIAVDGWALTILRPENVGFASTANSVGQNAGSMVAFGIVIAMDSPGFCNAWVRPLLGHPSQEFGMVSVASFTWLWGAVFMIATALLWLFKTEETPKHVSVEPHATHIASFSDMPGVAEVISMQEPAGVHTRQRSSERRRALEPLNQSSLPHKPRSVARREVVALSPCPNDPPSIKVQLAIAWAATRNCYSDLWSLLKLPPVMSFALFLLTSRVAFSAVDSALTFVLLKKGVTREMLASFDMISTPLLLAFQALSSTWLSGPTPLTWSMRTYGVRLAMNVVWLITLRFMDDAAGSISMSVSVFLFVLLLVHGALSGIMFTAQITFFNQIADARMGGTYMTLLNTVWNLSSKWPQYLMLHAIQQLTVESCVGEANAPLEGLQCKAGSSSNECTEAGGFCATLQDGFFICVVFGTAAGVLWLITMHKRGKMLEDAPKSHWRLPARVFGE
jgi:PAT family acetyl-CoA transporter-like MFS transporter 1